MQFISAEYVRIILLYLSATLSMFFNSQQPLLKNFVSNSERKYYFLAVYLDTPTDFTVDTRGLPKKTDAQIVCNITNPSGGKTDCVIGKAKNGVQTATFTPFEEGIILSFFKVYSSHTA